MVDGRLGNDDGGAGLCHRRDRPSRGGAVDAALRAEAVSRALKGSLGIDGSDLIVRCRLVYVADVAEAVLAALGVVAYD